MVHTGTTSTLGPLKLRSPVILASGVLGDSPEMLRTAYDYGIGAVVTKSITLTPREGNPEPNHMEREDGWYMNWVGLKNPGAVEFAKILGRPDYPVIVSLAGSMPSEFAEMARMFKGVAGFELNISCPNVDGLGTRIGNDPTLTASAVKAVKEATDLPVFVKVGFQMPDAAQAAITAGADGLTAINTIPGMDANIDANPPTFRKGGLSGPRLLPIALRVVQEMAKTCSVPVIGCGGISTWRDAADYMEMGAAAVQVGTAAMLDLSILGRIVSGLREHQSHPV